MTETERRQRDAATAEHERQRRAGRFYFVRKQPPCLDILQALERYGDAGYRLHALQSERLLTRYIFIAAVIGLGLCMLASFLGC